MNDRVVNGRYELRRVLGAGAYSIVWEAFDRHLQRVVAVKEPKPSEAEDEVRPELLEEARKQGRINEDAIVTVYDVENDAATGTPYIVMEYVEGKSLKQRLAERAEHAMSIEEALKLITRVLTALDAAHARGVVHGDIKPSNILIDANGDATVCDFGAARSAGGSPTAPLFGTRGYQDPDLAHSSRPLYEHDVYATGIVLYEMLSEGPLESDPRADQLPDLSRANPRVPSALAAVIMAAIRPTLERRPAQCRSAAGFGDALRRAYADRDLATEPLLPPIEELPPTTVYEGEPAESSTPIPTEAQDSGLRRVFDQIRFGSRRSRPRLSRLAGALYSFYWENAEVSTGRRYIKTPSHVVVVMADGDGQDVDSAIRMADRDACRAVRKRMKEDLASDWELIFPDLEVKVIPGTDVQVRPPSEPVSESVAVTVRVGMPFRTTLVLRVLTRTHDGAFQLYREAPLVPDLRFGTGPGCALRYRGPRAAHLDAEALQVISLDDRAVTCQVLDRRGISVQRDGATREETYSQAEIVVVREGDIVTFPELKEYLRLVIL